MRWTKVEARWRDAVIVSVLPVPDPAPTTDTTWALLDRSATPLLRWGFRFAVWWLTWAPLLRSGRPLHRLDADGRDRALQRFAASDGFVTRQVVLVAKTVAALVTYAREAP